MAVLLTQHKSANGQIVRAGLNWGNVPALSATVLSAHNAWSVRILSEIPRLTLPAPPIVDCSKPPTELVKDIDLAWLAAGKAAKNLAPSRSKSVKFTDSIEEGLYILEKHKFDLWHWGYYALITHWNKYAPTKQTWYGANKVTEHLERAKAYKPPVNGWTMPTKKSIELDKLRAAIWDAILNAAVNGLEACETAANSICSEKDFERKIDELSYANSFELTAIEQQIKNGKWVWPTLRAIGHHV